MPRYFSVVTAASVLAISAHAADGPSTWPGAGPQLIGPAVPAPRYFRIDDQLFDTVDAAPGPPMQHPHWGGSDAEADLNAKPQGATVDSNAFGWRTKFQAWDAGVMPIEFEPDLSSTQRTFFMNACTNWGAVAPVLCIPRTSQSGFLAVRQSNPSPSLASGCYSVVGQSRRLVGYELHLSPECWNERNVHHELGHALGFIHEHQRPDRDTYITVDLANVSQNAQSNFTKIQLLDPLGQYDFLSVMHYRSTAFAAETGRPTLVPNSGYGSYTSSMGTATLPSDSDHAALQHVYSAMLRPLQSAAPAESPRTRFERNDFLDGMERLHAFYYSRIGLNRPSGLSINGRPDFQGIATWIFDIYLAARSRGFSAEQAFGIVIADITQTDEWRGKHRDGTPLTRPSFTPVVSFDRNEFLSTLQRLDAFYAAPEGLQRPDGLSISGGPDFLGIATWVFDVYLNERLSGGSSTVAWTRVVNAIQATQEWRSKH